MFTGDALGVHLPDVGVLRPATPPPEFDIELACASIMRIRERADTMLLLSHFGPIGDVGGICELAAARIRTSSSPGPTTGSAMSSSRSASGPPG